MQLILFFKSFCYLNTKNTWNASFHLIWNVFFPSERLDNTLEEIIFKLVPGLRERKFLIWFWELFGLVEDIWLFLIVYLVLI